MPWAREWRLEAALAAAVLGPGFFAATSFPPEGIRLQKRPFQLVMSSTDRALLSAATSWQLGRRVPPGGTLRAVRPSADGYDEVGSFDVFGIDDRRDHQMWSPMALAGRYLLMRSQDELVCLKL